MRRALAALLATGTLAAAQPAEDPFAWLEDAALPRTQEFVHAQGQRAREALDRIPARGELLARIRALQAASPLVVDVALGGNRLFHLRSRGGREATALFVREGVDGADRLLLDAAREAGPGASLEWMAPSPDGRHVAVGLAAEGGQPVLRVLAVEGARFLPLRLERVLHERAVAWQPDGRAFYYARAPEGNAPARRDAAMRIYRHVPGRDAARDEVVFAPGVGGARDVPEFSFPSLLLPPDSRFAYAIVRDGMRRELAVHAALQSELAAGRPAWRKLVAHGDEVIDVAAARDELYLLSRKGAPRHRVLRIKGAAAYATAKPIVPQGDSVIEQVAVARDALYLRTMVGGVDRLERAPLGLLGAKAPEFLRLPFDHAITRLVAHPRQAGALLLLQGRIEPPLVAQLDARTGELRRTNVQPAVGADFSAMDEVRLYAPAADGTRIPVTLVYPKSTRLSGENALLLEAYGSYGRTVGAAFEPARLAWLERGGVIAFAHVRGGGEYGAPWHQAARGALRGTSAADLLAVADFLVGYGFTNAKRMALVAHGAGAIAVGGAMARRPESFAAFIATAPILDLARLEQGTDGRAALAELPEDAGARRALSPYAQVKPGGAYPALLLDVSQPGEGDAWQAAKMVALLQAAGARPALLRTGPADRAEALADRYAFAWAQMGEAGFAPRAPEAAPPALPPERGDD